MPKVLHVGCGKADLPEEFFSGPWEEVRVDVDPEARPDYCVSLTELPEELSDSFEGVFCCHTLEHIFDGEIHKALKGFYRCLKPKGKVAIIVPDLKAACQAVVDIGLETEWYPTNAGKVCPLDVIFGFQQLVRNGHGAMAHRTGYTTDRLKRKLSEAGFTSLDVTSDGMNIFGIGLKEL